MADIQLSRLFQSGSEPFQVIGIVYPGAIIHREHHNQAALACAAHGAGQHRDYTSCSLARSRSFRSMKFSCNNKLQAGTNLFPPVKFISCTTVCILFAF